MGELRWGFCHCFNVGEKHEDKSIFHPSCFSILLLSSRNAVKEARANFPQKSFINYVFCRNWDVRNSAGTRLDSLSLVNKSVLQQGVKTKTFKTTISITKQCFLKHPVFLKYKQFTVYLILTRCLQYLYKK